MVKSNLTNYNLLNRLRNLQRNIRVGIVGMGSMGKGLFYQCSITPGIECVVMADIKIERAIACAEGMGRDYRVVNNVEAMHETISQKKIAICEDGDLAARCELVELLIESSNSIAEAAQFSITALEHQKHLVLMNAEIDLIFGPYFLQLARKNGVVYTSCDGDQHGVIKHLVDDLELWGFNLVMAGNIKGFLDRYSNPTKIIPEADKRHLDYKMATAYTDGTKLCIEMALVANALGLSTFVPGMHGPQANHLQDVFHLFDFNALWKNKQPLVDYILGTEPGGGVFAIGYCEDPYQKSMLSYYKMGEGPFYLFYRPYHLCHIEAMACLAEAFLDGRSLLQPMHGFRANVYAYAKRELSQGEKLDGIGGYTCYGLIENCPQNKDSLGLPICLAEGVTLKRDVSKDERILMSDIHEVHDRFDFTLYAKALECSIERQS
jgi:predicted homoserine dehydrogenase-like protein